VPEDAPHAIGSGSAVQASATARVSLRLPPGVTGQEAQDALVEHLRSRVPWGLQCEIERVALGDPFVGSLEGPAFESLKAALEEALASR
jgi:acetylornithine deacetylase/succinyl-diaminopimelate desuccinylase-like protein